MPIDLYYIEVLSNEENHWFRIVSGWNQKTMICSEMYTRRWSAKRAAKKASKIFGIPIHEEVK